MLDKILWNLDLVCRVQIMAGNGSNEASILEKVFEHDTRYFNKVSRSISGFGIFSAADKVVNCMTKLMETTDNLSISKQTGPF